MRWNVVELSENGLYAKLSRGFLCVMNGEKQLGKVIIDEMCCLLLTAEQAVLSKPLMVRLAECGIPIVICGSNYHPISVNLPYAAHHQPNRALDLQLSATEPLKKRLWQQVVKRKIENQASTLKQLHPDKTSVENQFSRLADKVRSGDPENIEAQAAKLYWKTIMSGGFTRNSGSQDTLNAALNYGYTVIRAACARAIVAAGLLPALGIYHSNQRNAFCLADDLMEPYRPLVDYEIFKADNTINELDKHTKQKLAKLLVLDIEVDGKNTIVNNAMQMSAFSYVSALKDKTPRLSLPKLE
ncbi:MAG: subtype II CRISPR-associated endonuclease Cas1 [Proteobacteria bacterium]|nr:MAG: subtype II CRISPR-associated endonuclease Cas1 [Pseudomonadota bacterium]